MLSIATIWSVESVAPVPAPVVGPIHEPTPQLTQRNADRTTGRLASTDRAVKGTTVPFGRTATDRPERFRASFSADLLRMSVA